MKRIGILGGGFRTGNLGVSALTVSAISLLKNADPNIELTLIDYGTGPETATVLVGNQKLELKVVYLRFSKKLWQPNHVLRLIVTHSLKKLFGYVSSSSSPLNFSQFDAFVSIAGGDSFSDIYGFRRLAYVTLPQVLALVSGRELMQLPQTFGPFRGMAARKWSGMILSHSSIICCRDKDSASEVQKMNHIRPDKVKICPDMAFALPIAKDAPAVSKSVTGLTVGLNISGLLWRGGYSGKNMFQLKGDYQELVRELIRLFVTEFDASVVLVPHVLGKLPNSESDEVVSSAVCREFAQLMPGRVATVEGYDDPSVAKRVISECDFFLGSRMHACIGALSQGIPAVGLAYSRKFAGVFDEAGMKELVVELAGVENSEVVSRVRSLYEQRGKFAETLKLNLPQMRVDLEKTIASGLRRGMPSAPKSLDKNDV